MAVVKLKYTRKTDAIKRHLRYIIHRPGKEREKLTRELFQDNYLSVTKQYGYDFINGAPKGTRYYKMMINFHPEKEDKYKDLDLQHIASVTIREMQRRIGRDVPFIATIHDDHAKTDLRHIHAICLVRGRLSKKQYATLKTLWQVATAEAREQRRARDRMREKRRTRFLAQARVLYHYQSARELYRSQSAPVRQQRKRYRVRKPRQMQLGCSNCGYGQYGGMPAWREYCPSCGKALRQEKTLRLERSLSL